jgi:leader peptidase (prepilin peptidase)/N-methyltransferase
VPEGDADIRETGADVPEPDVEAPKATANPGTGRNEPLRIAVAVTMIGLWVADLAVPDHSSVRRVLGLVLIAVLARATVTDIEQRRIPNLLTLTASIAGVLIGLVMQPGGVPAQILWAVGAGLFLLIFAIVSRGGLGMGDIKLGFVLGLFLRNHVVLALVVGMFAGGIGGLGVLLVRGIAAGRKTRIAYGPFLALGGVVAVLVTKAIS